MEEKKERPVIVSTAHRGIFFGYTSETGEPENLTLSRARMIVYHSRDSHGFIGIANRGPGKEAKVSPSVARLGLRNVTAIVDATPEAAAACEAEPWN